MHRPSWCHMQDDASRACLVSCFGFCTSISVSLSTRFLHSCLGTPIWRPTDLFLISAQLFFSHGRYKHQKRQQTRFPLKRFQSFQLKNRQKTFWRHSCEVPPAGSISVHFLLQALHTHAPWMDLRSSECEITRENADNACYRCATITNTPAHTHLHVWNCTKKRCFLSDAFSVFRVSERSFFDPQNEMVSSVWNSLQHNISIAFVGTINRSWAKRSVADFAACNLNNLRNWPKTYKRWTQMMSTYQFDSNQK